LKVVRLELSEWGFLKTYGRRYGFLLGFPPLSLEIVRGEFEEICKRLREFEEIEISRQSCRGDYE
jgi:hypothetical protein